jgi:hypothetical protein
VYSGLWDELRQIYENKELDLCISFGQSAYNITYIESQVCLYVRFREVWRVLNRTARIALSVWALAAATVAAHATEADQPPAPKDSKSEAQAAPGREPEKMVPQAALGANAAGVMVFIDPVTGKIVQPTEAQMGRLAPSPERAGPKAKAPVVTIQGPGGAVGMVLGPESFSYSIATRTADGKIALDCVTGDQAANRLVTGESGSTKETPESKGPPDEKKK